MPKKYIVDSSSDSEEFKKQKKKPKEPKETIREIIREVPKQKKPKKDPKDLSEYEKEKRKIMSEYLKDAYVKIKELKNKMEKKK